jgi:hypothetical protein
MMLQIQFMELYSEFKNLIRFPPLQVGSPECPASFTALHCKLAWIYY